MERLDRLNAAPELWPLELAYCARDVVHWASSWLWCFDPREPAATLPLDPFPRQQELLLWLREREATQTDGLVEKSRDTGVTFLCGAHALHGWLFREGFAAGFGSRKLELVDRIGDPDSIFEKLRFMLYALPPWMLPPGFDRKEHDNHARLVNPANGSTVTGEGGDNIGRGGRKSIYFVDEAAFIERPHLIERSLSQTTRVRVDVSTPNGMGNPFARKRFGGRVPVFTLSYRDDPRKQGDWLERERERLDPVTLAQEVLLDYAASVDNVTIPAAWVRAAVDLPLPPSQARPVAGLDVATGGRARTVLVHRRGPLVLPPEDWQGANTTETAHRAREGCERLGACALFFDAIGVGAGVTGTLSASERPLPFRWVAVSAGGSPSERRWPDGRSSKELFLNLRAELWWIMRSRFEKTYEVREGKAYHPPGECISIPNHPQLIAELSLPLNFKTETGKRKLESKEDMARRGVASPDFADALSLTFADLPAAPSGGCGATDGGQRPRVFRPPFGPDLRHLPRGYGL